FRIRVSVVGGPIDAARAIDHGDAELAVVRRDLGMPRDGSAIAILRKNVVVLFALPTQPEPEKNKVKANKAKVKAATKTKPAKKSKSANDDDEEDDKGGGIKRIAELVGKRIGVIGRSQANIDLLKIILRQYGITSENVIDP